ncbi:unannotated protein [freshwater metagenome]|uniref:Unannotated protein n=1 Tax=freshwater metagenome TaxID=449393 RepID=A0A6J6PJF1_9ZZZZ
MHAGSDRLAQLLNALVVAVHHACRRWNASGQHNVQFAAGSYVEQQTFFIRKQGHRLAEKRLAGVHHVASAKRLHGLAAAGAQVVFVVHKQWRAVGGGKLGNRATANEQRAIDTDGCGVGQQRHGNCGSHIYIRSGAEMPRRSRPFSITRAVTSHNAKRLCLVPSSAALSTGQCS